MYENNYLVHYGIKGQRWGVRRFQNEDGSLTGAGSKQMKSRGVRSDGTLNKIGRFDVAAKKYSEENGYTRGKTGYTKVVKFGSKDHLKMMGDRITRKKQRTIGKTMHEIRKSQNAAKKAALTPKQIKNRKAAKLMVASVGTKKVANVVGSHALMQIAAGNNSKSTVTMAGVAALLGLSSAVLGATSVGTFVLGGRNSGDE